MCMYIHECDTHLDGTEGYKGFRSPRAGVKGEPLDTGAGN